jgi:hypothetical protein
VGEVALEPWLAGRGEEDLQLRIILQTPDRLPPGGVELLTSFRTT